MANSRQEKHKEFNNLRKTGNFVGRFGFKKNKTYMNSASLMNMDESIVLLVFIVTNVLPQGKFHYTQKPQGISFSKVHGNPVSAVGFSRRCDAN